jgi:hypothetical protein
MEPDDKSATTFLQGAELERMAEVLCKYLKG